MSRILIAFFFLSFGLAHQSNILHWMNTPPEPMGQYLNGAFPSGPPGDFGSWTAELAFPGLTFTDPLDLVALPDGEAFMMVEKTGRIWRFDNNPDVIEKTLVLDIENQVITCDDCGMISMILHPEFGQPGSPNRGYFYVFYRYTPTQSYDPNNPFTEAYLRLSRFTIPEGSNVADPMSEFVLIQQYDQQGWHSGGALFFDQEGLLYISFGDEGGANDSYNTTQKLDVGFFSGIIRIDVDRKAERSHPIRRQPQGSAAPPQGWPGSFSQGYYIPNDNPWLAANGSILEEFYAIGLRSPHRMALDQETNLIWVGDVGQGTREEISVVQKGDNCQWPFREGSVGGPKPRPSNLIGNERPPIFDYGRGVGNCIIGGFVYRGEKWSDLTGKYIYGDHGTRNIFVLSPSDNDSEVQSDFLINIPSEGVGSKSGISSFATDKEGNIYVLKLFGTNLSGGKIYRLNREETFPEPPEWLSQIGAFRDLENLIPKEGLIPYDVNAPLWSDGSKKRRWIALPNDGLFDRDEEKIRFKENGSWDFPIGTVFVKHFELPTNANDPSVVIPLETRFLVIAEQQKFYGVTYRWNEEGTDAQLLRTEEIRDIEVVLNDGQTRIQTWAFPSRAQCLDCHNNNAEQILGVKTHQLNGELTYPSTNFAVNQLAYWNSKGIFDRNLDEVDFSTLPKSYPLDANHISKRLRIQSYMDANCAHCHQPGGREGAFDARLETPLEQKNLLRAATVSVNSDHLKPVVAPGDASNSEQWVRDGLVNEANAMPPLAKKLVDTDFMNLLTEWINSMPYDYEPACSGNKTTYLSDIDWEGTAQNGWGDLELDSSNGEIPAGDGNTITINGQTYDKGLGVHANSEIRYNLAQQYDLFKSDIGVDDECGGGSVEFKVYLDDQLSFSSPIMRQVDPARSIELDVSSVNELKLVVTDARDGDGCDHADWAGARLETTCESRLCENGPEITISSNDWSLLKVNGKNEAGYEQAAAAFDDNPLSYWEWPEMEAPDSYQSFEIDLGGLHNLKALRYTPKIGMGGFENQIAGFRLRGSEDNLVWNVLREGQFPLEEGTVLSPIEVPFLPEETRYIRLEVMSHHGQAGAPSIAELDFIATSCKNQPIGEINIALGNSTWQKVPMDHTYEHPVLVTGGLSSMANAQAKVYVRNITKNSFEFKVDTWGCASNSPTYEWVPFLIVEKGVHVLPSGQQIIAGEIASLGDNWHTELYPLPFESKPVLFAQEISENDIPSFNGQTRFNEELSDPTQFRVKLESAPSSQFQSALKFGWIAIDLGQSTDIMRMEVGRTNPVNKEWQILDFAQNYSTNRIGLLKSTGTGEALSQVRYDQEEGTGNRMALRLEDTGCNTSNEIAEPIAYWITDRPGYVFGETIITTSTEAEQASTFFMEAFPNPSKDGLFQLLIYAERQFEAFDLLVYNLQGQVIYQMNSSVSLNQLDLSAYPAGAYIAKVQMGNSSRLVQLLRL